MAVPLHVTRDAGRVSQPCASPSGRRGPWRGLRIPGSQRARPAPTCCDGRALIAQRVPDGTHIVGREVLGGPAHRGETPARHRRRNKAGWAPRRPGSTARGCGFDSRLPGGRGGTRSPAFPRRASRAGGWGGPAAPGLLRRGLRDREASEVREGGEESPAASNLRAEARAGELAVLRGSGHFSRTRRTALR